MNESAKNQARDGSSIIRELNAITLGAIREIADGPDGDHQLSVQFGVSKRTAEAVRKLRIDDLWRIVDQIGDTFLFAARNADDTLYQLAALAERYDPDGVLRAGQVARYVF